MHCNVFLKYGFRGAKSCLQRFSLVEDSVASRCTVMFPFSVGLEVPIVALQWFSLVEVSVGSRRTVMVPFSMSLEVPIVAL